MDADLKDALVRCETDVDGALYRLSGDEDLYSQCLVMFLQDQTVSDLERALKAQLWDEAFTAVHALKGVAGNMGFIPLFHATANLVIVIRAGRTKEVDAAFQELKCCYDKVYAVIHQHCGTPAVNQREDKHER